MTPSFSSSTTVQIVKIIEGTTQEEENELIEEWEMEEEEEQVWEMWSRGYGGVIFNVHLALSFEVAVKGFHVMYVQQTWCIYTLIHK